jgi:hypothetical protein
MKGIEFSGYRSEQSFKAGEVGFSRKPKDQTKNSFINRQIVNSVSFSFSRYLGVNTSTINRTLARLDEVMEK